MQKLALAYGIFFALSAGLWGFTAGAANPAHEYLDLGHADEALQTLSATLAQNPKDAEAHNLRCRVYYQEEQWDQAIGECEAAVQIAPGRSTFHLWLGRAYGKKAEHASLMSGYQLARRVHAEFDQAVQLDPANAEALADAGEFDVMAPSMVGGGVARAEAVVPQLRAVNPSGARVLEARIAESKKDYGSAEADLKAAIPLSVYPANAWMDLASFYRRRGRIDEMVAAAHTGASLDREHGPALVDGAANLVQAGRDPATAVQWLRLYLDSHAQSEIAPAFVARARLAQLLQRQGDVVAAQQQIAAAHALASGYRISAANTSANAAGL